MKRLRLLSGILLFCFLANCDACNGDEQLLREQRPLARNETPKPDEEVKKEELPITASFQLVMHNGAKRTADTATQVTQKVDIEITFSEAVDTLSVERVFSLLRESEKIRGTFSWNPEKTKGLFSPEKQLLATTSYALELKKILPLRARKGVDELKTSFTTVRHRDLNGDGVNDFFVGAPFANRRKGLLQVHSGKSFAQGNVSPLLEVSGQHEPEHFGIASTFLGDLDGDGVDEIAVGANVALEGNQQRGAVFIYSGKGLTTGNQTALLRIPGITANGQFGSAIVPLSDINGDRVDDFAVAAPYMMEGTDQGVGKVFIYNGAEAAKGTVALLATLTGESDRDAFGFSMTSGYLNADAVLDLVVGAPFANDGAIESMGKVYVFSGVQLNQDRVANSALAKIKGAAAYDQFGQSVSSLQNISGIDDLVIGAPLEDRAGEENKGAAYVFRGGLGLMSDVPLSRAHVKIVGEEAFSAFGFSVAGIGDIDHNGTNEFLVGAPNPTTTSNTGTVSLFSVTPTFKDIKLASEGPLRVNGTEENGFFGHAAMSLGDVNSDGFADFLIAAPYVSDQESSNRGEIYLFLGAQGLSGTKTATDASVHVRGTQAEMYFGATANFL